LSQNEWRRWWLRQLWQIGAAYPDQAFFVFINCQLLEQQLFAQIIKKRIITI